MTAVITVAPTGPIARTADNPHLPVTPEQIAEQVSAAYNEGASVAHLHFRDENERPTADLDIARRAVDLIKERCDILIQLSTGVGLGVPFEARAALVELAPQMATLNPCSMTFGGSEFSNPPEDVRRLAARMQELNVKPELEVYDTGHLDMALRLRDEGLLDGPLQFSIVLGINGGMAATPENLQLMRAGCRGCDLAGDRNRTRESPTDRNGTGSRRERSSRFGGLPVPPQGRAGRRKRPVGTSNRRSGTSTGSAHRKRRRDAELVEPFRRTIKLNTTTNF